MSLKFEVDAIDDVPEALKEYYSKSDDGKYRLTADGAVPKSKLDEFRTNNVNLMRERDTLKSKIEELSAKYAEIDPEEYVRLKDAHTKNKSKDKDQDLDALVEERVKSMRSKYETEKTTLANELSQSRLRLSTVLVDNAIQSAAVLAGVAETAMDDVVRRGRDVFRLKDDKVVPMDGEHTLYGDDGITPLTMKEWLAGLAEKAPHLFKASKGGGAQNGGDGGGGAYTTKAQFKTVEEKAAFISKHGREAYLNLPAS